MASYASSRDENNSDFEEVDSFDCDDIEAQATDEDTEDASETDMAKQETEYTEIKEQMYQDKLAHLKKQLQQLQDGTLPEYIKKRRKIEQQYKERIRINEIWRDFELEVVEREYIKEKKATAKDFEEKKIDLKESLILEYEDKSKMIENERNSLDLTGSNFMLSDTLESKAPSTRRLRRRPNDPMPLPEKRRKASPVQIDFYLDDADILDDLRIINKVSGKPFTKKITSSPPSPVENNSELKIEDGRLFYDKRWFHRNQPVFIEGKDIGKVNGVITAIGTQEIYVRKLSDSSKIKIYLSQLQKGRYILRRRQT
ncbi:sin3 histone deacetylase corepressor complex component SDS3-like isoform X1 [Mytilus californianus]|uniref:sin3 histone deacetylase corepressor complex component SDS3-like isoform X1 n=2 Tax=Mytilus californianus TaxID=6549 RepID=UPI002245391F|nr:sin3 histone deacetylase corepressor complex component SDS3-like isoform X1 [Mytilus californianus]